MVDNTDIDSHYGHSSYGQLMDSQMGRAGSKYGSGSPQNKLFPGGWNRGGTD